MSDKGSSLAFGVYLLIGVVILAAAGLGLTLFRRPIDRVYQQFEVSEPTIDSPEIKIARINRRSAKDTSSELSADYRLILLRKQLAERTVRLDETSRQLRQAVEENDQLTQRFEDAVELLEQLINTDGAINDGSAAEIRDDLDQLQSEADELGGGGENDLINDREALAAALEANQAEIERLEFLAEQVLMADLSAMSMRSQAANRIVLQFGESAVPLLVETYEDGETEEQLWALEQLGQLGSAAAVAVPVLTGYQRTESDPLVKQALGEAITTIERNLTP